MAQRSEAEFFGHPRGLSTLFFTELWERFSYYGMRGAAGPLHGRPRHQRGGHRLSRTRLRDSAIVRPLHRRRSTLVALPGGWIADRLIGAQKKAVLWFGGDASSPAGHFVLAIPDDASPSSLGLILVVLGTGLLKPNISAIVADLYPEGKGAQARRGLLRIFYMGINVGAFDRAADLQHAGRAATTGTYGFAAAGVGMVLRADPVQVMTARHLDRTPAIAPVSAYEGRQTISPARTHRNFYIGCVVILGRLIAADRHRGAACGADRGDPASIRSRSPAARPTLILVGLVGGLLRLHVIFFAVPDHVDEKKRILRHPRSCFSPPPIFWSGFEQAATGLNAFANDLTNRVIFGWEAPASWLQSVNPLFIIIFAPVVGYTWVALGARSPSLGVKFGLGLVLLGTGFLVLAWGATYTGEGLVSPMWLVVTYFFHTIGELCLSPVGLSATTKVSPGRLVGQMMGIWFMGSALGNLIAGLVGGLIEELPLAKLMLSVGGIAIGAGLFFFVISGPIKRLAGDSTQ